MNNNNVLLGVNIDHIATIRNLRSTCYPNLIQAANFAEQAGADSITVHLREDRRHINDNDVLELKKIIQTKMNLEIAITDQMINFACHIKPDFCCLVPEKRKEITTEKGLNIIAELNRIKNAIEKLKKNNIFISLFIDADKNQVDAAIDLGVSFIELHTGFYGSAKTILSKNEELLKIKKIASYAFNKGLKVNAGHGLNYHNVEPIASFLEINELNIGHSIISRSLFSGLFNAVKDMKKIIRNSF